MRQAKPWYRKSTKTWYVQLDGRQVPLGKDKEDANRKYHQLMSGRRGSQTIHRVDELLDEFLEHVNRNQAKGSYRLYRHYFRSFNRQHMDPRTVINDVGIFWIWWIDVNRIGKQLQVMENVTVHLYRQIAGLRKRKGDRIALHLRLDAVRQRPDSDGFKYRIISGDRHIHGTGEIKIGDGRFQRIVPIGPHDIDLDKI